jgi:hypothetical protein
MKKVTIIFIFNTLTLHYTLNRVEYSHTTIDYSNVLNII